MTGWSTSFVAVSMAGVFALGCASEVEGPAGDVGGAGARKAPSTTASAPVCALYRPVLDEPVEGAAACGFEAGHRDDDLYLARHLRSHVGQTSSFVGLGTVLLHDVAFQAIVGRALESVGLGSWDGGVEHSFDASTGEYVIVAKSGLVVGDERLGEWDAMNARGEIRLRLYWGAGPRAGQPILADAFSPSSYLVGPELHVDLLEQRVSVSYESAGPLVSLLGWGDAPTSPATVRLSDADRIRENVGSITADARVVVRIGQPDCAYTSLTFATPRRTLAEWIVDPDLSLDFVSGGAERSYPEEQAVTITSWEAKLAPQRDWLEGPVRFAANDGRLTGEIGLRRGDVVPDMVVACAR